MATENNSLNYLENYKAQLAKRKKSTKQKTKTKPTNIHGLGKLQGLSSFASKYKKKPITKNKRNA
jgi:hypothetical protein|tara:strand:- start:280 stop:474 length:195 start_codon:yes stop_codon:yes gene_type:complete